MPPSAPMKTPLPVIAATRSRGNHCVLALSMAINPAAMPMPVMKRPMPSMITPSARAQIKKPEAAVSASTLCTRRAPKMSSAMPTGSCVAA